MKVERTEYLIAPKRDWGEVSSKKYKSSVPLSPKFPSFNPKLFNQQFNKDIKERPLNLNSSNLSFKGLSFWYKTTKKYNLNKFSEFTNKYIGTMGDDLLQSIKNHSDIYKKFVKFDGDEITIKQKAWGQLLLDGMKYPFIVLPMDILNGTVGALRKIKPLRKWASDIYNSEFLVKSRQRSKSDAKVSTLRGLLELQKSLEGKSEAEVSTKVYERALRMFDSKSGNYDTKHERALNRLVSGLPPAIFLANDAYNLSRMMDDDPKAADKEKKIRFRQETSRILTSGYLTLITMGALSKLINNSKAGIMGLTGLTVLVTEMFSRLSNGKYITRLTPEQAKRINEKAGLKQEKQDAKKTFTSSSQSQVDTEEKHKKPLLSADTLLKASAAVIVAGFGIKGLRRIKVIDNAIKTAQKPLKNLYNKLTKIENYTIDEEKLNKILEVLRENGFKELADKYSQIAKESNINGIIQLGSKNKKWKPAVDFFVSPFKFAWNAAILPYRLTDKLLKSVFGKNAHKAEKSIAQKNQENLQKIVDYIGKQALKKNMDPKKFQDYVKDNILKGFNEDTLSNISNSDLSNLAKTSATAATLWFLMTDNYNMVMLKSNGEDVNGAQTKFKERFVQEISRLFYQTLLIDLFNNTFRSQYNKSLWGMSWITLTNTTLGEILTRKSIGTPIKTHTREELENIETRQNNAKGFTKAYYTFMKRLTGKRSIQSYSVEKKENNK
ncbi:hypothetical protein IJF81_03180 [bacterium]|nr:hypothetical protein [bacterium]